MSDVRGEICKIISRMLDNPGEGGIYPTTRCYDELEALINAVRSENRAQFSPLERFALSIMEDMREHPGDDFDGGTLQELAEGCELIREVQAEAPCNEHYCECAEVSDFPVKCMRETDYLRPLLAQFRKEEGRG